jgi:diguanylate cyclase (GGDEF)-like protein
LAPSDTARERSDRVLMQETASLLTADLSLSELFEKLTRMLADHIEASVVFIALASPDGHHAIEYFYDHGVIRPYPHIALTEDSRALVVIRTGEMIWGNDPSEWAPTGRTPINIDRPESDDSISAIFVPLRVAGTTLGCLSVQSSKAGAYGENEAEQVAAIGRYLGVAVQNQRMVQALQRSADWDPLTGLATHSRLLRGLDVAIARATSSRPAAVVMFNVTNFEAFNAMYGYAQGDAVLRDIARALLDLQGDGIEIGRYGGDVFMAVVDGLAHDRVLHFIGDANERCRALSYAGVGGPIPISIASGYAFAPLDAAERADLIALCVHRTRASRKAGGMPIGDDDIDSYTLNGTFTGIETIVDSLLDRDPFTRVHLFHVNAMAKHWAEFNLDLDRAALATFLQSSLLHDVGKLLVSDRIMMKPGKLTAEEYRSIQEHAAFGRTILAPHAEYAEVAEIVGQHHERWDGRGYPNGMRGDRIHPLARAVAILDAFSAMVVDRPYHRGIPEDEALADIARHAGSQFDSGYVDKFLDWRRGGSR